MIMENNKTIWDLRDEELKQWWFLRDELAEHVDQGEPMPDLKNILSAFTEALQRLDEQIKNPR